MLSPLSNKTCMHTAPVERSNVLTNIINFIVTKLKHIAPVASSNVLTKYVYQILRWGLSRKWNPFDDEVISII